MTTEARFALPGLEIILDPALLCPGYRAWVEELLREPRLELWESRPWAEDHLFYQDGQVYYRVLAMALEDPEEGRGSEARLSLRIPLSEDDLRRYRDLIQETAGEVEHLCPRAPASLVGCPEDVEVHGGVVAEVPPHLYSLSLDGTRMDVHLPEIEVLVLNEQWTLSPTQPPVTVGTFLATPDIIPYRTGGWSAPAVWAHSRLPRPGQRRQETPQKPWIQTEHYVSDFFYPARPPATGWSLWSCSVYRLGHLADTPSPDAFVHQVPSGEGPRQLAEGEPLPALRVLILVPGLEAHPWTVPPEVIVLPTVYWTRQLVTRTLPDCLTGYYLGLDLGLDLGRSEGRCQFYYRSKAKSAHSAM